MDSKIITTILILLCVAYPIYYIEYNTYTSIYIECEKEWNRNHRILSSDICSDANERISLGTKIQNVCIEAELENNETPKQVALRQWWHQFWVYTFFHQMTDSYWKVMPVLLAVFVVIVFAANQQWTERIRVREFAKLFNHVMPNIKQEQDHMIEYNNNNRLGRNVYREKKDKYIARSGAIYYD